MAKQKKGGRKLHQEGFVVPKKSKKHPKKGHESAPWDDPLKHIERGGFGR